MVSVFCATIIFLWKRSLGFPHSDAGKLDAVPVSQIHLTSHRPQSSLLAHGWCQQRAEEGQPALVRTHFFRRGEKRNHREKGMLCLGDSFRVLL